MHRLRSPLILLVVFLLSAPTLSLLSLENEGDASAWTDGNDDSEAYPNYGIQDIIADKAYHIFNETEPKKAEFLRYWYLWNGADSEDVSFDDTHTRPGIHDNFLAWTDDGLEGDYANYFIHNRKGWEVTDAPTYVQTLANRSIENLTAWMMGGMKPGAATQHKAAYNAGLLSKYVGDMTQYGHTDYSQWDQAVLPTYNPATTTDTSYQLYYEAYLWTDVHMNALIDDYWYREFDPPSYMNATRLHQTTADLARWVNGRGLPPTTMVDHDASVITVGSNYRSMLEQFIFNWESGGTYNGVRGFNETLWELTVENLVAGAENLSVMYESLIDEAHARFLALSPDLVIVDWGTNPDPVIAQDQVELNVTVMNIGPTDAPKFDLTLRVGEFVTGRSLQLNKGESKNVSFYAFKIGTDPVDLTVILDSNSDIAERNELNNIFNATIIPLPEVHSSEVGLKRQFTDIRRDARRAIHLIVTNTGNRFDLFEMKATSPLSGISFELPVDPIPVKPFWHASTVIWVRTSLDLPLGPTSITFRAVGLNSSSELQAPLNVLVRTNDPVIDIVGPDWARLEDDIILSAEGTTDPDGDYLTFLWFVPERGSYTGPRIELNFTIAGVYPIVLYVDDGNVTVTRTWPVTIYPKVPSNLSSSITSVGVSGLSVSWEQWMAGGLTAYWLEARALEGQGERSQRGPYSMRLGPGNSSGRIGKFLPGTDVVVTFGVEALDYGNRTLSAMMTRTSDLSQFEETFNLYIEERYLYLQYKPWVDPEGVRDPEIVVERDLKGFVALDTRKEDIQRTKVRDTIRYQLGSDWGRYRARLTYRWANETTVPFELDTTIERNNTPPVLNLSGKDQRFELNENGTCRVYLTLAIDDPVDTVDITVDWGDGTKEGYLLETEGEDWLYQPLFHNFSAVGDYPLRISVEDWCGLTTWVNHTLQVFEYRPSKAIEDEENRLVAIIIAVVVGAFLAVALGVLGYVGYRFSKKETEVEFDLKDLKSDMAKEKSGTGTDFDQRRSLQIPKESIMIMKEPPKTEQAPSAEGDIPVVEGKITFDEE